jgi:hypothetical protein
MSEQDSAPSWQDSPKFRVASVDHNRTGDEVGNVAKTPSSANKAAQMQHQLSNLRAGMLAACGLIAALGATGCQSSVGGQTLPSAYYLRDDVQFFPAGPEEPLYNQKRAIEEYKLNQQAIAAGLVEGP